MTRQAFEEIRLRAKQEAELDQSLKDEWVSDLALVATEAIYKFLRRN